jgi:hypothetical protein
MGINQYRLSYLTKFFILVWFILQIVIPLLPREAIKRQLPFTNDDGIHGENFIKDRRK